jgi:ATP-dependent Clp protease ATP-binding subunit ClpB
VNLVVTDAACRLLARRGWDPVYGARPLKRAIQKLVQDPLAMMLLEGKFSDGDTITVDVRGGSPSVEPRPPHRRMLPAKKTF